MQEVMGGGGGGDSRERNLKTNDKFLFSIRRIIDYH